MRVYHYVAIIRSEKITQGKTTFVNKRGVNSVALESSAKIGHVLAESALAAKQRAKGELSKKYPEELGYSGYDCVRVKEAEETIIG